MADINYAAGADVVYETAFERELCEHLADHGWLYDPHAGKAYDAARALYPPDVFAWFEAQDSKAWKAAIGEGSKAKAAKERLLDTLVALRSAPVAARGGGGGTLALLRNQHVPVDYRTEMRMVQWAPAGTATEKAKRLHEQVRLRIVRQVHYNPQDGRPSIDLVAFINGIPVGTFELKTNFTQTIEDARRQYKRHRLPVGQPLLEPSYGALVHFAVTEDEVFMTTKLDGENTRFLPFNRGSDAHGPGNPTPPAGKVGAFYLWEQVMARESWLDVFGSLVFTKVELAKGRGGKPETQVIFPRFHQWEAVTKMVADVREQGVGQRYLVQHSAGSGKTNTIGWLAHHLSRLYVDGVKAFDSVIVLTDRTVLDDQVQRAITQIEGKTDYVYNVDRNARRDEGSKSRATLQALLDKRHIVVVTIQTFPAILKLLGDDPALAGHRFAVIADEAHSSQTGTTAKKTKQVVEGKTVNSALVDDEEAEGPDSEDLMADAATGESAATVSWFAFTATPKDRTVQLFGRTDLPAVDPTAPKKVLGALPGETLEGRGEGLPRAFHLYTMKQAISEGFILDVLTRYQSYKTAYQLAQAVKKHPVSASAHPSDGETATLEVGPGEFVELDLAHLEQQALAAGVTPEQEVVDAKAAKAALTRFVMLHPTNLAKKAEIVVEHFRRHVAHLLNGHAKAMIVTSERRHALRFKQALDAYITKRGYQDLRALVAFSGTLDDPETGILDEITEQKASGVKGDLAKVFADGDTYRVMIAADKFSTGFDQPLLCAMYVDKLLDGIQAVQTLSRLNRTYTKGGVVKGAPYVLDFVNDPSKIQEAFAKYYEEATILEVTDPNQAHVKAMNLRTFGVFDGQDVDEFVRVWRLHGKDAKTAHNDLAAVLSRPKSRYEDLLAAAVASEDEDEVARLEGFRHELSGFVRLYDFVSQVYDFTGSSLEDLAAFCRQLAPWLRPEQKGQKVDISAARLVAVQHEDKGVQDISVKKPGDPLKTTGTGGPAQASEPELAPLLDVIDKINDIFAEQFGPESIGGILMGLLDAAKSDEGLRSRALLNTLDQFLASDKVRQAVVGAMIESAETAERFFTALTEEGRDSKDGMDAILEWLHQRLQETRDEV
ncbi:type I restriction endonuclease subunit R [Streptomyces microflavus]